MNKKAVDWGYYNEEEENRETVDWTMFLEKEFSSFYQNKV